MMTTSDGTTDDNLQGAFGDRGTNVNAIAYGHPHGDSIIEEARNALSMAESGQLMLKVMDHHRIPVQIMNGMGESGFSPDMKTIFLQIPKKQKKVTGEVILYLAKALREADLEYAGRKAPDPRTDILAYSSFMHARNINSMAYTCRMVKELTDTEYFPILLDTLGKMGLNDFYKASIENVSDEELYECYVKAYNS